jgi:hypothetical protein
MNRLFKLADLLRKATPLIDINDIPADTLTSEVVSKRPSIGYGISKDEEQVGYLKEFFEKREEDIVLICFEDLPGGSKDDIRNYLENSEYFKKFLFKKNYPKNSLILVVGDSYLDLEDETGPGWMVHDIIGHSILNILKTIDTEEQSQSRNLFIREFKWYINNNMLPGKFHVSLDTNDLLPDILAAIYLGYLEESEIMAAYNHIKEEYKDYDYPDYNNSFAKLMVNSCLEFNSIIMQNSFIINGYTVSVIESLF